MRDNSITMNIFTDYDSQMHKLIHVHILQFTNILFTDAYSQKYNSQIQNMLYKHTVHTF